MRAAAVAMSIPVTTIARALVEALEEAARGYNERAELRTRIDILAKSYASDERQMELLLRGLLNMGGDMAPRVREKYFRAALMLRESMEQRLDNAQRSLPRPRRNHR